MERPNYYSILPAKVRYDENLSSSEKLIFSEITALINKNGYCWASNDYFAELFNVSKKTISKWINKLSDRGYIKTKLEYEKGTKNITKRVIKITSYPIHEKADTLSTKKWIPYPEKKGYPIPKKVEENNTSINNIKESISKDIDKKRFKKPSIEEIKEYCKSRNNSVDAYEFYDFYESKNWFIGKNKMKDWKAAVRTWEHRQKKNTKTTIQADQDYQKFNEEYLEELLSDD